MKFTIARSNQEVGYQALAAQIEKDLDEKGFSDVTVNEKKRSLSANAQMHVWLAQIAHETGQDIQTVTLTNKRHVGLPIALNGDMGKQISWTLDKIGFWDFPENQQINVMNMLAITSIMTPSEHTMMRDNMMGYWQEKGVTLHYSR